jgi:ATP-dependent phosphofructokinase / diphosphate-dependent phosphofructokinase
MHPSFYDPVQLRPSQIGIDYLLPIFTRSVGADDVEVLRRELFDPSKLKMQYHSLNTDVNKRIRYLETD